VGSISAKLHSANLAQTSSYAPDCTTLFWYTPEIDV